MALLDANVFVGTTSDFPLSEKQSIFLVLAGCKPVSEVTSGHWVSDSAGRHTVADDPRAVRALLDSLGLKYALGGDEYGTDAVIAQTTALVRAFETADGSSETGRLFGYPPTAVSAFVGGRLLSEARQTAVLEAGGIPSFQLFRFSQDHWRDELAVAQAWQQTLAAYGFA